MTTSILKTSTKANKKPISISKRSIFMVPLKNIKIIEGFNIREDLGDIKTLANQIEVDSEVKKPLRGYKQKGQDIYVVTDGHRRVAALRLLQSKKKCLGVKLPFMLEPKGYTGLQRTLDLLTLNGGKHLTYIEEAKLYQRLKKDYKLNNVQIAKKVGKSSMHVGNALLILDAPKELQEYISQKVVAASTVLNYLKKDKEGIVTLGLIEKAIEAQKDKSTNGKVKDVTISNKHIKEAQKVAEIESEKVTEEKSQHVKGLDLGPIVSTIKNLGVGEDLISKTGVKVLQMVLAYAQGQITKGEFSSKMLNDLM